MEKNERLVSAFASELIAQRKGRRLSQEELAHRAGVNRTYIAKLELAKNQPTLSVLFKIATALDQELPELLSATMAHYRNRQVDDKRYAEIGQKLAQSNCDGATTSEPGREQSNGVLSGGATSHAGHFDGT